MAAGLDAHKIVGLLAEKHASDVFVGECKNGPTHGAVNLLKLDAWAMKRSWANYCTVGYEVKISRADFEQDQKWVGYLDYCHEFNFVCPSGLIRSTELPKGVGLMWVSVNGGKVLTKHKPDYREPNPEKALMLMSYVLMCRTKITDESFYGRDQREGRIDAEKRIVRQATERKELAFLVRENIREAFNEQRIRQDDLDRRLKATDEIRAHLEKCGVPWPDSDPYSWQTIRKINERLAIPDPNLPRQLRDLGQRMAHFADHLEPKTEAAE